MSTLSVPVPHELDEFINKMVKEGRASNKADVVRKALRQMSEDEAIKAVLRSQKEPTLRGDLRTLMKKFK